MWRHTDQMQSGCSPNTGSARIWNPGNADKNVACFHIFKYIGCSLDILARILSVWGLKEKTWASNNKLSGSSSTMLYQVCMYVCTPTFSSTYYQKWDLYDLCKNEICMYIHFNWWISAYSLSKKNKLFPVCFPMQSNFLTISVYSKWLSIDRRVALFETSGGDLYGICTLLFCIDK